MQCILLSPGSSYYTSLVMPSLEVNVPKLLKIEVEIEANMLKELS